MRPTEAIRLSGIRQYADYTGYGGSFECAGPHAEVEGSVAEVVAIDAVPYVCAVGGASAQYHDKAMLRELTKLVAALHEPDLSSPSTPRPFATGNWGCGVFGGDARLKALLQWMAASRAGRPVLYYPFGDPRASGLESASAACLAACLSVGGLAQLLFGRGMQLRGGKALEVVTSELAKRDNGGELSKEQGKRNKVPRKSDGQTPSEFL